MNKKGFTLVEILAAVTILALLALITVPAVTKPIKDSKDDLYETQLKSFKDSAKAWGVDNMYANLPDPGKCIIVNLSTLIKEGLVEPNIKNPKTGEVFGSNNNSVFVKISNYGTTDENDNTINKYVYEVYDCNGNACYSPDSDKTSYNDIKVYEDPDDVNNENNGEDCTIIAN